MKMKALAISGCLLFSACATAQAPPKPKPERVAPIALTDQQVKAVHAAVANSGLKDPSSVKFEKLRAGKRSNGIVVVCGMVNAKNSYGGYVGFKPFVVASTNGKDFDKVMLGEDLLTPVVREACQNVGLSESL